MTQSRATTPAALVEHFGPATVIDALSPFVTPERAAKIDTVLAARLSTLSVVLENLHDPHNGAAAIRSMEAFGCDRLHVIESAERFRFSSAVTIGCEKWIEICRHQTTSDAVANLKGQGFHVLAGVPGASDDLESIDVSRPTAVMFGNERDGLSPEALEVCDGHFSIPMYGFTQSFNLSVSVAVTLQRLSARKREVLGTPGDMPQERQTRSRALWYATDTRGAASIIERFVSKRTHSGVAS